MYFEITKSANDQYYFVIKANNHEVVATSETYVTKQSAKKTIDSIKNGINSNSKVIDQS
ncbi:YegP family protein [Piscibacillus halophilus]|nr:YegP family protein [Piscibacillus halophilus]